MDAIAPPSGSNGKLFGIIPKKALFVLGGAIILLIAILIVVGVVNSNNNARNAQVTALGTKMSELRVIIEYSENNPIGNGVTATVVAQTSIVTTSHLREIAEVYSAIDPEDYLDEEQVSAISELNDAKSYGNLDIVYARVLRDQLLSILGQIDILRKSASAAQLEVLERASEDFQELADRLPLKED